MQVAPDFDAKVFFWTRKKSVVGERIGCDEIKECEHVACGVEFVIRIHPRKEFNDEKKGYNRVRR